MIMIKTIRYQQQSHQAEGMVEDFVLNMTNNNIELRKHCASAIFKCAQVNAQIVNVIMREKIELEMRRKQKRC